MENSKPIWCYDSDTHSHKWGNHAAYELWECTSAEEFLKIPVATIYQQLPTNISNEKFKLTLPGKQESISVFLQRISEKEILLELENDCAHRPNLSVDKLLIRQVREHELIFENAMVGILYIKNRIMYKFNAKFADIYGYSSVDLLNKNSRILYRTDEEFLLHQEESAPILRQGLVSQVERQMIRSNGEVFWTRAIGKLIDPRNPEEGSIWIVENIDEQKNAQEELDTLFTQHKLILDHAMVGVTFLKDRKVTHCNRQFEKMFGFSSGELQGKSSRSWFLSDKHWQQAGQRGYDPLHAGKTFSGEMLLGKKDGSPVWCEVQSKAIDPNNLSKGSIWVTMDIHEKKLAQEALKRLLDEQQLILDHAMVGIVYVVNKKMTRCNQRFEVMFGYQPGELEGKSSRVIHQTDSDWLSTATYSNQVLESGEELNQEMLLTRKDGSQIWCDVRGKAYEANDLNKGVIWIAIDITKRKLADEKIRFLAQHDVLTSLPNRTLLEERARQAIGHTSRCEDMTGLLFIDVDNFKHINDTQGHDRGDIILRELANRMISSVRVTDTVSRFGGDEFVILLTHLKNKAELIKVIQKISAACKKPIILDAQFFQVTLSIGASTYPDDAIDFTDLMKQADIAMYHTKRMGRNSYNLFSIDMVEEIPVTKT